jgi:hypothetical protein
MKNEKITGVRRLIILVVAGFISITATARQDTSRYALILDFYSIGTGTPGDQPLKNFIANYRKKNKLKPLSATRVGGLGREGEYAIILPLKELTASQRKQFVASLTKALPTLKSKDEMGGINMNQNQPFDMSRARVKPENIVL